MFILAHAGITFGAAVLVSEIITEVRGLAKPQQPDNSHNISQLPSSQRKRIFSPISWIDSLGKFMDIRLLIVGSMLPDIIDKPLRFAGFGSGRSITHTLLITLIILAAGLYLYLSKRKTGLLALASGMIAHLILDGMWLIPQTFLWPLKGLSFPPASPGNVFDGWLAGLVSNPLIYIPEGIGLVIILGLLWTILRHGKLFDLLIRGKIIE